MYRAPSAAAGRAPPPPPPPLRSQVEARRYTDSAGNLQYVLRNAADESRVAWTLQPSDDHQGTRDWGRGFAADLCGNDYYGGAAGHFRDEARPRPRRSVSTQACATIAEGRGRTYPKDTRTYFFAFRSSTPTPRGCGTGTDMIVTELLWWGAGTGL